MCGCLQLGEKGGWQRGMLRAAIELNELGCWGMEEFVCGGGGRWRVEDGGRR